MNAKPIFDRVRAMLGRGFTQAEVAELDAAIAAAEARQMPDVPSRPEHPFTPAQTSAAGMALIKSFEGYARKRADGSVEAYPDPGTGGDPWTIGWGSTGPDIKPGTVWTRAQADERFAQHIGRFEREVIAALGDAIHATSQPQFDALVSFQYNTGAIASSTLLRKHKAGDYAGAANEFGRWKKAGGKVLPGLVRRRAAEAQLYRSGS
jgi:GH24 family phage-related lysozyme (muramidase)